MLKLTTILLLGLLACAAARDVKRGGGRSRDSGDKDSSEKPVEPITKDELKTEVQTFVDAFTTAADKVEAVETAADEAFNAGENGDWAKVGYLFHDAIVNHILRLGPTIEKLGETIERIAASPDDFEPEPVCESTIKLAKGETQVTTTQDEANARAFIEDMGCFKNKIAEVADLKLSDIDEETYGERDAIEDFYEIVSNSVILGQGLGRFGEALEALHGGADGGSAGSASKRGQVDQLIRLLKEMKFDSRRK